MSRICKLRTDVKREFSDFGENLSSPVDNDRKIEFLDGFDILLAQGVVRNIVPYMTDALVTGYLFLQEKIESSLPGRK